MHTLSLVDRVLVPFSGDRAGEGPLTLGQRNTYSWVSRDPEGFYSADDWAFDLPEGATLTDITTALATLLARHESLRTSYTDNATPIQRVRRHGELPVEVYEVDESTESTGLAQLIIDRLRAEPLPLTGLPLRVGVATRNGVPAAAAAVFSHMAVDFGSMAVVGAEFRELLARRGSGAPLGRAHQPLDQVDVEATAHGRRRAEAALRYWVDLSTRAPQYLYAAPVRHEPGKDKTVGGWLFSPAATIALPHIAQRTGCSRPTVVLAAFCGVFGLRADESDCVFALAASNRIDPRLRDYVGPLAQDTLVEVRTDVAGFDDLVRRTGTATLRAARHGSYDGERLGEALAEVGRRRGIHPHRDCTVNNLVAEPMGTAPDEQGTPADAMTALSRSAMTWWNPPEINLLLRFNVVRVNGSLVFSLWSGDPTRVPRAEVESLLNGVERVLVTAAEADFALTELTAITGISPISRGPGWLRIDGNRIELAAVQQLVDDALPTGRVFPIDDGLCAFLVAGPQVHTPEQAHTACLAALPGRYTAMAPSRYVICALAPEDSSDLAQWRAQPILAQGEGRTRT